MAARNTKKTKFEPDAQPENKPEHVSAWKTPAGIAAILGALATLITAIVGVYNALGKNSPPPTPTSSPEAIMNISFCDGYFEGWVFEAQAGTPTEIDLKDYDYVTVKLMAGAKLIGSIRYVPSINSVLIADQNCGQLLGATEILPDTDNEFGFEEHVVTYKSNSTDNNFRVYFKTK
jgi:hypothetical protein